MEDRKVVGHSRSSSYLDIGNSKMFQQTFNNLNDSSHLSMNRQVSQESRKFKKMNENKTNQTYDENYHNEYNNSP